MAKTYIYVRRWCLSSGRIFTRTSVRRRGKKFVYWFLTTGPEGQVARMREVTGD